jgi:hypothetical protein
MLHIKSGNSKRQNVAIYVTDSINELNRLDQIDLHPSDKTYRQNRIYENIMNIYCEYINYLIDDQFSNEQYIINLINKVSTTKVIIKMR